MTVSALHGPPGSVEPVLEVEDVAVRFGSFVALEGVDLRIEPGESVAIAGENGAGKSTLVRCIAGDLPPSAGLVRICGERLSGGTSAALGAGVAVVWQDLALCENLDIAANLLLGRERRFRLLSESATHGEAASLLHRLRIPLEDTHRGVRSLSSGERQLVAVARAMRERPRLLVLDEPTAALGVRESAQVERLIAGVRRDGTTLLLVSHDVDQMFRLADRIAILRHGRITAVLDTASSHPDEVIALVSGQQTDASARRQLNRLQALADRLATADPSSGLQLIVTALAAALGTAQIAIHLVEDGKLRLAAEFGLSDELRSSWAVLPLSADVVATAAVVGAATVIDHELELGGLPASGSATPVAGSQGMLGVITVVHGRAGHPPRDELDLVALYAGFAASAIERERLLGEVTSRNRVLETIRDVLQTLAGPVPLAEGLVEALRSLRDGLQADEVGLFGQSAESEGVDVWTVVDRAGRRVPASTLLLEAAEQLVRSPGPRGAVRRLGSSGGTACLGVIFDAIGTPSALVAHWHAAAAAEEAEVLLEDAANSLRLAHERQESERARREAAALRRSQELQRDFLSRLSHELRTPLTAIGGYASSLMQPDVTWDGESERRFLARIGAESARLNRLVGDLLDFSAIESSTMRLQSDWCDLSLVLEAAVACVRPVAPSVVSIDCGHDLPVVWGDHDRLEQVFVNLLDNALRHNPPGTRVWIEASTDGDREVLVTVTDDGEGMTPEVDERMPAVGRPRSRAGGAGLGLSIVNGIVGAHGGSFVVDPSQRGTTARVRLPVERVGAEHDPGEHELTER
jgi:signal transduction histidine kinase/ABC-type multidrug transport system ATPase subunit